MPSATPLIFSTPPEVSEHALTYLHPTDVARFSQVSRAGRALVYGAPDHYLWRQLFLALFDDPRKSSKGRAPHYPAYNWKGELQRRIRAELAALNLHKAELEQRQIAAAETLVDIVLNSPPVQLTIPRGESLSLRFVDRILRDSGILSSPELPEKKGAQHISRLRAYLALSGALVILIFIRYPTKGSSYGSFFPQTQQGADLIASTLKTTVYMPDFFEPKEPFPTSRHPPKNDSDKEALQAFFGPDGAAHPPSNIGKLTKFAEALKADGIKNVGAYGFCWGAKICISSGAEGTPFSSVAMVHPAMLSADDAEKLTVPLAMYITKDESVDEYKKINDIISKKSFASKSDSKNYENMFHGFGSARADLKNEENKKEFEDVYGKLATFFSNTL